MDPEGTGKWALRRLPSTPPRDYEDRHPRPPPFFTFRPSVRPSDVCRPGPSLHRSAAPLRSGPWGIPLRRPCGVPAAGGHRPSPSSSSCCCPPPPATARPFSTAPPPRPCPGRSPRLGDAPGCGPQPPPLPRSVSEIRTTQTAASGTTGNGKIFWETRVIVGGQGSVTGEGGCEVFGITGTIRRLAALVIGCPPPSSLP